MRLQRDSYAPKSCAFDAANVQFLRAHLCKSHPVLQHPSSGIPTWAWSGKVDTTIGEAIVHGMTEVSNVAHCRVGRNRACQFASIIEESFGADS